MGPGYYDKPDSVVHSLTMYGASLAGIGLGALLAAAVSTRWRLKGGWGHASSIVWIALLTCYLYIYAAT